MLTALNNLGYPIVSASTLAYSNLPWDLTKRPMQMSQQTATGDYTAAGTWVAVPIATTVSNCETAAAGGNPCVIMVHPHEFANGAYTLTMLKQLTDTLISRGFTSVNFHTVMQQALGTAAPTFTTTAAPTFASTIAPTRPPTRSPTSPPTVTATSPPTRPPTRPPSLAPTNPPSLAPTRAPTIASTIAPTVTATRAPTVTATLVPTIAPTASGPLANAWDQCGGQGWTGAVNCVSGYTCVVSSIWYSQCKPTSSLVNTPVPTLAPTFTVTTTPTSGGTQAVWGKCGGQGWTGPTVCASGSTCVFSSIWYSQCLPARRNLRTTDANEMH